MAGKHQIWSSNKRTRQRANRCWRRQNKERLRGESTADPPKIGPEKADGLAHKRGGLVYGDPGTFGMALGDMISAAQDDAHEASVQKDHDVTVQEFTRMIAKWNDCTLDDFRRVMSDQPEALLLTEFQQFELTPLDYFMSLPPDYREKWVDYLRQC